MFFFFQTDSYYTLFFLIFKGPEIQFVLVRPSSDKTDKGGGVGGVKRTEYTRLQVEQTSSLAIFGQFNT